MAEIENMHTDSTLNCTRSQVEIAQNASSYILARIDKHITIKDMADRMHVSQTQLKNSFRKYYGASMYKYIRSRKMEIAAQKLAQEEFSVMEIAGMVGYENCSKFAAAFRGEFGMSPSVYRRQHRQQ